MKRVDWIAIGVVFAALVVFGAWWERREKWVAAPTPTQAAPGLAPKGEERICYRGEFALPGVKAGGSGRKWKRGMAALSDGYVDTGGRKSVTSQATMRVAMQANGFDGPLRDYVWGIITLEQYLATREGHRNTIAFAGWSIDGTGVFVSEADYVTAVVLYPPGGSSGVLLEYHTGTVADLSDNPLKWSESYTVSHSLSNLREGVRWAVTTTPTPQPIYSARHAEERYAWFGDENTVIESACAGHAYTSNPYAEPTAIGALAGGVSGSCSIYSTNVDAAEWSGVSVGGEGVDFTGLHNGCVVGSGGTAVGNSVNGGGSGTPTAYSGSWSVMPPIIAVLDGAIPKWGNAGDGDWARVLCPPLTTAVYDADTTLRQPWFPYLTFPEHNGRYVFHGYSWDNGQQSLWSAIDWSFTLQPAWVADAANRVAQSDVYIPIRGYTPAGNASWEAVSMMIETLSVLRPDGGRPSDFVSADTDKLTVSEGTGTTLAVIDKATAQATRTLLVEWRDWIDKPASPEDAPNPLWSIDGYSRTRHTAGHDIFWWQTYGKMQVKIALPEGVTSGSFTLRANYTHLDVFDAHVTGAWTTETAVGRIDTMEFTETAGWAEWTVRATPSTLHTDGYHYVWIDLLFPDASSEECPVYLGRVESLRVSGFSHEGTWVLGDLTLQPKNPHRTQVSLCMGDPKSRATGAAMQHMTPAELRAVNPQWPTAMIAVDGSYWAGDLPDTERKQDMTRAHGGSTRYVEPMTGSASGLILDSQYTLGGLVAWLNRTEGALWSYDTGAAEAELEDADGAVLADPLADWLEPYVMSFSNPEDVAGFGLRASVACRSLSLNNGREHTIRPYRWLWGAQQTLVTTPGLRRLPEDDRPDVYAVGEEAGVKSLVAGPITANADGLVTVYPVPAPDDPDYTVCLATEAEVRELGLL